MDEIKNIDYEARDEGKSLRDEIREIKEFVKEEKAPKSRKFRMPFKGKVGKKRLRQGYATVMVVHENRNIEFTREPIIDSTIKLVDKMGYTYHAVGGNTPYFYKGKPLLIQPKNRLNPHDPLKLTNETYGQKYIMARMEGDKIIPKKQIGWGVSIGILIIIGVIIYALVTGG